MVGESCLREGGAVETKTGCWSSYVAGYDMEDVGVSASSLRAKGDGADSSSEGPEKVLIEVGMS